MLPGMPIGACRPSFQAPQVREPRCVPDRLDSILERCLSIGTIGNVIEDSALAFYLRRHQLDAEPDPKPCFGRQCLGSPESWDHRS